PGFCSEEIIQKLFIVHVFIEMNRFFYEISNWPQQLEGHLQELRRAIAEGIDKFIYVKVFRPGPNVEETVTGRKIDGCRQKSQVLDALWVKRSKHGAHGAAHAIAQDVSRFGFGSFPKEIQDVHQVTIDVIIQRQVLVRSRWYSPVHQVGIKASLH